MNEEVIQMSNYIKVKSIGTYRENVKVLTSENL